MMKRIAIVGIQGVPACYGGFESLVENLIGEYSSSDILYTVYCSSKEIKEKQTEYKGAKLKYIPIYANGIQSIFYDIISLIRSMRGYDTILVLGVSGCVFLPVFRLFCKKHLVINIDGLEHKRDKWNSFAKKFLRLSESFAVRYGDIIISDNKGIQEYVRETYGKASELIAYGGNHAKREVAKNTGKEVLTKYNLESGNYSIAICRIEPENNCHMILQAFAGTDSILLFIGNWGKSEYGRNLKAKYMDLSNIIIHEPIYDLDLLYVLRKNAARYVHGHSAGGTNPSLVEAMFFGCPIVCYDVIYNRETTENKAFYFSDDKSLRQLLLAGNMEGLAMAEIAERKYVWQNIIKQYERLYK